MKVAIVGAGWAGLAAAMRLRSMGMQVTVFEASKVPGGRARRVVDSNLGLIDNGQHIILGAYRETLKLIEDVCGYAHLTSSFRRLPLWLKSADSRFEIRVSSQIPATLQGLVALWQARGLSIKDKTSMTHLLIGLKLGWHKPAPQQTVEQWLQNQGQSQNAIHWIWRPLCLATMNTHPSEACATLFQAVLRDSLLSTHAHASELLLPSVDLSALWPDVAAANVSCQFGHTVRCVTPFPNHVMLDEQRFDGCICATPPYGVLKLLGPALTGSSLLAELEEFDYRAITTCYVKLERPIKLPAPMLLLQDDSSGMRPGQWVFDRRAIIKQMNTKDADLAFVISDSSHQQHIDASQLAKRLIHQLSTELGQTNTARILHAKCIQEKRATFAAVPGLQRPENTTKWPHIMLAGDWTNTGYPSVLEGAVLSGLKAAAQLSKHLKGTEPSENRDAKTQCS